MTDLFGKLPSILILAVLVGIFVALRRHVKSERLNLWTAAWLLIFIHFFVEAFQNRAGTIGHILDTIDWGSLQVSATLFVASLTSFVEDKLKTRTLIALTAIPVFVYTAVNSFATDGSQFHLAYTLCLAVVFFGTAVFLLSRRPRTPIVLAWIPILVITGAWAIYKVWHNDPDTGFIATLTLGFGVPGFLFWRRYRRWSPGVITSAGGFMLWGLVWPIGALLDWKWPNLHVNPELWNTPKFFVAFGMILTLLEDKSEFLKSARERERKLNHQLQRFAGITSRLLTGVEVNSLCHEIAYSIRETSTFRRVAIILSTEGPGMLAAGYAGFDPEAAAQLEYKCARVWTPDYVAEVCRLGVKLGQNSLLLRPAEIDKYSPIPSKEQFPANPYWENGNVVLVPLRSS